MNNEQRTSNNNSRSCIAQAHDFEAYQELLREPGGGGAGGGAGAEERYEAVSKFLADTEDYIHKLAGKVRMGSAAAGVSVSRGVSSRSVLCLGPTPKTTSTSLTARCVLFFCVINDGLVGIQHPCSTSGRKPCRPGNQS